MAVVELLRLEAHMCFTWLLIFVSEHTETVKKLASLHILNEQSQTGRLPGWRLNEVFRKNLKIALTGGYAVLRSLFIYIHLCTGTLTFLLLLSSSSSRSLLLLLIQKYKADDKDICDFEINF